ncbi:activity-regulated cytoskeleton-associated protein-like [Salvia splendens]|uniref:activity-regulated cytoskeleton-associated protein-like n=1 Tax=Salvia splendens TaxID=180675 RepID=UPI001C257A6B|nr:activity-regulated cytoskeleton-associated protein-like [Salvia splendens]
MSPRFSRCHRKPLNRWLTAGFHGHWNHPLIYRNTNAQWRVQEAGVVTTRYRAALEAAASSSSVEQLTSEEEGEQTTPPKPSLLKEAEKQMAVVDNDWGIGSLHAHDEKEPTHAITVTPGIREFCGYCDIQPVLAGSTSEDYRLKAIPFVLKDDARIWLRRLPEGSIRTWAEFRLIFLDRFFRTSKTSALKREITEARQEYDEPLGQYWDRFQGLLQACPNHKMGEREVYSTFYGGLNVDSKNDLNLAAQGDFSKTPFSQAKSILERLI